MKSANLGIGTIFLTQTGAGILGNSSLLCLYNFTLLTGHNTRPTDLILNQLVLANNLVLFSRGIPQTMAAFGWKYFLDDAGCKVVFYLHRVARGISITTTCLLSGFQASKLCFSSSRWMLRRMRSSEFTGFCCFLCWILQLLVNVYIPVRVVGLRNTQNISVKASYGYCSTLKTDRSKISLLHAFIFSSIDIICLGFMILSSGAMVFVLLRHKRRVQHIHSNSLSARPSLEVRGTCTILVLVSSFVFFYSLSSISSLYITLSVTPSEWLVSTSVFLASCFPTFSPFLLITRNTRISNLFFAFWVTKAFLPNLIE